MNKILIITTEGCAACEIAVNNVSLAIQQSSKDINIEVDDYHNIEVSIIKAYKIKDYPAVLYFVDDKVVTKAIGSYPTAVYLRWIDIYFKN